jgi:hypothetical protein
MLDTSRFIANLPKDMQDHISKGPLRILEFQDGYYVVGLGDIIPVDDRQHGIDMIEEIETIVSEETTDER